MECIRHPAPVCEADRVLLVMLPGVGIEAGAFAENGMVAALHERGLPVDVVAVKPALELYLDGDVAAALHDEVIAPALAAGYARIWLLGISLGGMGALLYASAHDLEGILLLAPFLGTQGTVAEIADAGGVAAWHPAGSAATVTERQILGWLQQFLARQPAWPEVYLAYGRADRFARGHRILGDILPAARVMVADGGHDWPTWLALWQRVLDAKPFSDARHRHA
jgi:pimeloyl-ACP methyl ester carboxylesterase